jgi:hypothetical protein
MGSRGKSSVSELLVQSHNPTRLEFPDAPYDLTDEESNEWRAIVRSMQPTHFSAGNFPVLAQLCRHIVGSRRVAQLIQKCIGEEEFNRREYFALSQMQATESAAIMKLSRSLRLTQQARTERQSIKLRPLVAEKNPWDRKRG